MSSDCGKNNASGNIFLPNSHFGSLHSYSCVFVLKNVRLLYLDGDNKVASVLQEVVSVQSNNPRLVRLGNISKNHIHHAYSETECFCVNTESIKLDSWFRY